MNSPKLLFFLFLVCAYTSHSQSNITKAWNDANPVKRNTTISALGKLKIHEDYLKEAVLKDDITQQFYGNIYLYTDNMDEQNYPQAVSYLLAAENFARQSDNKNWQGFVKLRTGWVASVVQNDSKTAIKEFKKGAKLSDQVNDSLCMALCYEQISAMYSGINEYDSSKYYFELAIPVLRRSETVSADAAYSNFSSLLIRQGRFEDAMLYVDSAVQIAQKQKNKRRENFFLINRAIALNKLKYYGSAIKLHKYCMATNEKNKWMENLLHDYEGLSINYNATGNYAAAYDYLNRYHILKDSLSGVAVNLKVANIQAKDKRKLDALNTKNALQNRNWVIVTCILLLGFVIWLWLSQIQNAKRKRAHTLQSLKQLTRTLIEKNSLLAALEDKLSTPMFNSISDDNFLTEETTASKENNNEESIVIVEDKDVEIANPFFVEAHDTGKNIYNQRILTAADWAAFKIYFENAFPGYLYRLRNTFATLTEAEERLFLFIKLKLTNKETAAILGISTDSVKKTRTRLRKRLGLSDKSDLDEFVSNF